MGRLGDGGDQYWQLAPGVKGYYWPTCVDRDDTVASWIKVYQLSDFVECDGPELEEGIEKVAIYVQASEPTHVTRQLEDGWWISKIGRREDIKHSTLDALEGTEYGIAKVFMKRSRNAEIIYRDCG